VYQQTKQQKDDNVELDTAIPTCIQRRHGSTTDCDD